ncbi:MAG TPA: methylated-DNA--[protein]-cysteine S-methyltransferase [Caulobacteraceae bacterium]
MDRAGILVFDTPIGPCGLAWTQAGLIGVSLPEPDAAAVRARLQRRYPEATGGLPPPEVEDARQRILALLSGEAADLSPIALDLDRVGAFEQRIYAIARAIPPGEVMTYGEIASRVGEPQAAQAVGHAMGRNPWPIVVPCHRVVGSNGKLGGFSARGGTRTKLRILEIEGALKPESLPLFGGR